MCFFHFTYAQIHSWSGSFGSYSSESANAIALDANENVYTVGKYRNTVDFDPGSSAILLTSNGESDIFIQKLDSNGSLVWVKSIGGSSFDYANDIVIDANGAIYITGVFKNTVDFNPGTGTNNFTSNGQYDAFVLKLNSNGDYEWCVTYGGGGYDYGNSISLDSFGNIWVVGSFRNTVDFNPGNGTSNKTAVGGSDIYVLKLNFLGNFGSVNTMGGNDNDEATALAIDPFGFLYVTGTFEGTADFNPGNSTTNLTSNGDSDIFLIKLNFSGGLLSGKSIGSAESDGATDILVDNYSNILLTGYFSSTMDCDPSNSTFNLTSLGYEDVFTLKLDNMGNLLWGKAFGNNNFNRGNSIAIDQDGNVYTGGFFRGICDIDPGTNVVPINSNGYMDIFLQKLDQNGDFLNAITIGDIGDDHILDFKIINSSFYICGNFMDQVDFDPGTGNNTLISNGNEDGFVMKMESPNCGNYATTPLYFTLNLDDNCYETTWEINAASGLTLYSGGPYNCDPNGGGTQANSIIKDTFYLFGYECYNLKIMDSGNNGFSANGSWELKDFNNDLICSGSGDFGNSSEQEFYVENDISKLEEQVNKPTLSYLIPYPNPCMSQYPINIPLTNRDQYLRVFNIEGEIIREESLNNLNHLLTIEGLSKGIFFIKIIGEETRNYKLIVY